MIKQIPDLPDNVLAIEGEGEVTGDDYEQVVIPAVEKKLGQHKKIRLLYVLGPNFESFSAAAMWDDTKVGMGHPFSWERVAMVTDRDAYRRLVKAWGFMMPGKVRVFEHDELDDAKTWISEGS